MKLKINQKRIKYIVIPSPLIISRVNEIIKLMTNSSLISIFFSLNLFLSE